MDEYKLIIAALAVLLLIAQSILIAFKIQEKREARRLFSDDMTGRKNPNSNHSKIPGFAVICIEHAKKLVKIETHLKNLFSQRNREYAEEARWKEEIRNNFTRIFDKLEK